MGKRGGQPLPRPPIPITLKPLLPPCQIWPVSLSTMFMVDSQLERYPRINPHFPVTLELEPGNDPSLGPTDSIAVMPNGISYKS